MQLETSWDFEAAVAEISARWRPGGIGSGPARNRLIEAWGALVGRERAVADLDRLIKRCGSQSAAARELHMSLKTLREFLTFFAALPAAAADGKLRPGTMVGSRRLQQRIGAGGNAEVWRAIDESANVCALKVLNSRTATKEPYLRFRNEVEALQRLCGDEGVLPIVEAHAPEALAKDDRAWLAMPIATCVSEVVDTDDRLTLTMHGILTISHTLARLHEQQFFHRDIKPENLFVWNNRWVLGDFGLVSFPGKLDLTTSAKKLGSMYYLAPEMLNHPDEADHGQADVYSLAKTIWVLATGQRYPLPGVQERSGAASLSAWIQQDLHAVDELLEQATALDPLQRPSMASFASAFQRAAADSAGGVGLLHNEASFPKPGSK
jgi:serine/threonine protein kinase